MLNNLFKLIAISTLGVTLLACTVDDEDDDDDEDELTEIVVDNDSGNGFVDIESSSSYSVLIKSEDFIIELFDDVDEIVAQNSNNIKIKDTTSVDEITITGGEGDVTIMTFEENTTVSKVTISATGAQISNLSGLTISNLSVSGSNNRVSVDSVTTYAIQPNTGNSLCINDNCEEITSDE